MAESKNTVRGSRMAMFVFVAAAATVSAIVSYPWPRRSEPLIPVNQRKVLSDVALEELDGGTWRLQKHRGQVVLINYWASWCAPCRSETPGLVRLSNDLDARGLAVVGVSMDTGAMEPVRTFVKQMHLSYPIAFPQPMSEPALEMVGLPTTILVDREGRVAKTYVGETQEREFRADVERLLTE